MQKFLVIISLLLTGFFQAQEVKENKALTAIDFGLYDEDELPISFHAERRDALRVLMPENSVAVFFASPIRNRSNDVDFEYHQDPNFYYLTGIKEPHAVLYVFKSPVRIKGEWTKEIVFVQERNLDAETWTGKRVGVEGAVQIYGIQKAYVNADLEKAGVDFNNLSSVFYAKPPNDVRDNPFDKTDLFNLILKFEGRISTLKEEKVDKSKVYQWMSELREDKQKEELVLMRRAIEITCEAQIELMKALRPEMKEYQSEAIIEYVFKKNGAEYPGFPSIQGSAENSCVLHYVSNRRTMQGDNLLVSDVGAEYHGYTADVTRTIPVNGKFSEEQKIIYNIVLEAQLAGIAECKKGNRFWDPNIAATTVLSQRMQELGIIKSPVELKRYFMHGTSHYLGLDVHDVGGYGQFEPNQVITVEPGIYIKEGSPCDEKWWNIGVRIEDDVLITNGEPEVISDCVPKTVEEIEVLMEQVSYFNE